MFVPDQHDKGNADQKGGQGLGKGQQVLIGVRIAQIEDQQGNGNAEDRIGQVVDSGSLRTPIIYTEVAPCVPKNFISHGGPVYKGLQLRYIKFKNQRKSNEAPVLLTTDHRTPSTTPDPFDPSKAKGLPDLIHLIEFFP